MCSARWHTHFPIVFCGNPHPCVGMGKSVLFQKILICTNCLIHCMLMWRSWERNGLVSSRSWVRSLEIGAVNYLLISCCLQYSTSVPFLTTLLLFSFFLLYFSVLILHSWRCHRVCWHILTRTSTNSKYCTHKNDWPWITLPRGVL